MPPRQNIGPFAYLRPYRVRVALGATLLLVTSALALTVPWLMGRIVDALMDDDPASTVPPLAGLMVAFAVAQAVVRTASRIALFNAAREAEHDLRSDLLAHLLRLDPGFYRRHSTGDVMSRLTSDVQTVRGMWGPGLLNVVNTAFLFSVALVLMLRIDPVLTFWAMLPYPSMVLFGRIFGRLLYRASRGVQEQLGALSSSIQEDLTGIGIIKAYALEHERQRRFREGSEELLARNMVLTRIRGRLMPLLGGLASIGTVVVIYVGGKAVIDGRMQLGQLVQFNAYLALLVWPTLALGWMLSLFQRGLASWQRLRELLTTEPAITDGPRTDVTVASIRGHLEIRDLSIELEGRTVLDRVSISIPAGSVTAIVGRTGSGKSTLVECLPRLIDPPRGTVLLDGIDITDLPLATLRGAIAYAPQEAFLFSTTIARNVAMGTDREDQAAVVEATAAAGLRRDIAALPSGFDTVVGERGITLSGGQRQRVALARALASSPPVLLLDDSLSSVDAETEREILAALEAVRRGRTAILISHRVAAVERADQIVVLDQGRVAETGTHDALLAAAGLYAELYRSQLAAETLGAADAPREGAGDTR